MKLGESTYHDDPPGFEGLSFELRGTPDELQAFWTLLAFFDGTPMTATGSLAEARTRVTFPGSADKERLFAQDDGLASLVVTLMKSSVQAPVVELIEGVFVAVHQSNTGPGAQAIAVSRTLAHLMQMVDNATGQHVRWWKVEDAEAPQLEGYVSQPDLQFPNGGRWRIFCCGRTTHPLEADGNGDGHTGEDHD